MFRAGVMCLIIFYTILFCSPILLIHLSLHLPSHLSSRGVCDSGVLTMLTCFSVLELAEGDCVRLVFGSVLLSLGGSVSQVWCFEMVNGY